MFGKILRKNPKQRVSAVDVGAGRGYAAKKYAARNSKRLIVAIDRRPAQSNLPNLTLLSGDAVKLLRNRKEFPSSKVSVVNADCFVNNITAKEANAFYSQAKRILAPNGRFRISVPTKNQANVKNTAETIARDLAKKGFTEIKVRGVMKNDISVSPAVRFHFGRGNAPVVIEAVKRRSAFGKIIRRIGKKLTTP